jgi:hypothetical protein
MTTEKTYTLREICAILSEYADAFESYRDMDLRAGIIMAHDYLEAMEKESQLGAK